MNTTEIVNEMTAQRIKETLECLEQEAKQKIGNEIDNFMEEVLKEVTNSKSQIQQITNIFNNNYETNDKTKTSEGCLPEKIFIIRNSLLTDLFEVKHIRTIYHIFIAILIGQFTHTAINDYIEHGQFVVGIDIIKRGFSKLHIAAFAWIVMFSLTLTNYFCFRVWSKLRYNFSPRSFNMKVWDVTWICILITYYVSFTVHFTKLVIRNNLPPPTAAIILAELVRLLMKSYAFIRSNTGKVLNYKPHTEKEEFCSTFYQFLYFLFAPTLVYRDSYPRTRNIRWKLIIYYALEIIGVIFFVCFIITRYFISVFNNYGQHKINWKEAALHIIGNAPAGTAFMLGGFYLLLHVWLNAFAEILRFGDKMFYKDWWNSSSYSSFYRKWNVVVHDWLYTYIYKDMYENIFLKKKSVARFMVFFISALVHEYILSVMFGFFFPVLFIEFFGFGLLISFLNFRNNFCGNIFFWLTISLGMCFCISMYCIEYTVRQNCPKENSTTLDFFIPRLFTCNQL